MTFFSLFYVYCGIRKITFLTSGFSRVQCDPYDILFIKTGGLSIHLICKILKLIRVYIVRL